MLSVPYRTRQNATIPPPQPFLPQHHTIPILPQHPKLLFFLFPKEPMQSPLRFPSLIILSTSNICPPSHRCWPFYTLPSSANGSSPPGSPSWLPLPTSMMPTTCEDGSLLAHLTGTGISPPPEIGSLWLYKFFSFLFYWGHTWQFSSLTPGGLEDHKEYWRWSFGQSHAKKVPSSQLSLPPHGLKHSLLSQMAHNKSSLFKTH